MDDGIYENCKPTTILEITWGDSIYHHQRGFQQFPLSTLWQYLKGSWWPLCPVWGPGDIWPTTEEPFLTGAGGLARQEGTHSSRLQHEVCHHLGQLKQYFKVTISGTLGFGLYFPCLSWTLNVLLHFFSHLSIMPFICTAIYCRDSFALRKTTHAAPHGHVMWLQTKSFICQNKVSDLTKEMSFMIRSWLARKVKTLALHWPSHCSMGIFMSDAAKRFLTMGFSSYLTSRDYNKRSKCWDEDYFEIMG